MSVVDENNVNKESDTDYLVIIVMKTDTLRSHPNVDPPFPVQTATN